MASLARPCRAGPEASPSAVVEALRRHADGWRARFGSRPAAEQVLRHLFACGTGELGVHDCVCGACGWSGTAGNSCRDRHCPRCQGGASAAWLAARTARMLPVPHFQVVFTLPAELRPIALANRALVYDLLFKAGVGVLQDLARERMDARLGITAVLHTWTSDLTLHPHVHCLVTAGGLSLDDERWVPTREGYLFPQRILAALFRGRFLAGLIDALDAGALTPPSAPPDHTKRLRTTIRELSKRHTRWVVHVEPPHGRPVEHVVKYLARYVKRVAISDARIVEVTDTTVTFRTKTGLVTVDGAEFVRRFVLHVLPKGFRKVRHAGLYAPGNSRERQALARALLPAEADPPAPLDPAAPVEAAEPKAERCPACGEPGVRRIFRGFGPTPSPVARGPP